MLALAAYEGQCCSGCGAYLPETTRREDEEAFHVEAARCHRCTAIAQEADTYQDHKHAQALLYQVERR